MVQSVQSFFYNLVAFITFWGKIYEFKSGNMGNLKCVMFSSLYVAIIFKFSFLIFIFYIQLENCITVKEVISTKYWWCGTICFGICDFKKVQSQRNSACMLIYMLLFTFPNIIFIWHSKNGHINSKCIFFYFPGKILQQYYNIH